MGKFWSHFTPKLGLLMFIGTLGGFLFGYDTGIVSGAMIFVAEEFNLSHGMHEVVVSITLLSAALLPLSVGGMSHYCGRKTLLVISATLFSISSCVIALAANVTMLLVGRLIVGCAIGILSTIGPIFISECSPTSVRGTLVTCYNFSIILGQFCAYVVALIFANVENTGWRFMFGLGAVPAIVQILGLAFLPESPRYLISHWISEGEVSSELEAFEALVQLRPEGYDVKAECDQLKISLRQQGIEKGIFETFGAIVRVKHVRRALFVGCSMQMFQQIVGINTVMYYCASIVEMAGVPDKQHALFYAALITAIYGLVGTISLFLVDSLGRRKLLFISATGTFVGLVMLVISFALISRNAPQLNFTEKSLEQESDSCATILNCNNCALDSACGVCYLDGGSSDTLVKMGSCIEIDDETSEYPDYFSTYGRCDKNHMTSENSTSGLTFSTDACPSKLAPLIIISLIAYLLFFAVGYGPVPWLYNSEIYPQWARSTAVSLATTTNWTFNLLISVSFLSLVDAISQAGTFACYSVFALLSVLFFFYFMPETKNTPLEQIEHLFGLQYEHFSDQNTLETSSADNE